MSEAKINIATGFNGGISVSLRGDTAADVLQLQAELRIAAASDMALARAFAPLLGTQADEAQAMANVQAAFPAAQPVSTVGQPLTQPVVTLPAAQPVANGTVPPGITYPGNCPHGARVYKDLPARGKAWRRFECAIPWSKDTAASRCKPVNVD